MQTVRKQGTIMKWIFGWTDMAIAGTVALVVAIVVATALNICS